MKTQTFLSFLFSQIHRKIHPTAIRLSHRLQSIRSREGWKETPAYAGSKSAAKGLMRRTRIWVLNEGSEGGCRKSVSRMGSPESARGLNVISSAIQPPSNHPSIDSPSHLLRQCKCKGKTKNEAYRGDWVQGRRER